MQKEALHSQQEIVVDHATGTPLAAWAVKAFADYTPSPESTDRLRRVLLQQSTRTADAELIAG